MNSGRLQSIFCLQNCKVIPNAVSMRSKALALLAGIIGDSFLSCHVSPTYGQRRHGCAGWSFQAGKQGYFLNPQRIDYDMHMDVAAVVMAVRVGTNKGLVSGEMRLAKFLAQRLRPVYGQAVPIM